jgi:S1-C subfamily serine protease
MESGDSFFFGEFHDDAEGSGDEDSYQRGWIEPEDRLWRHPSELEPRSRPLSLEKSARDLWRERRTAIAAGTLGAAAVAAAAAVVLALANTPAPETSASTVRATETSLVTSPSLAPAIRRAVSALTPSLVELRSTHTSRAPATGVVLPGGRLVVTSASAVAGLSHITVVTSDGRHMTGKVMASDVSSGVAVVSTSAKLEAATFATDAAVLPGELAVTACLRSGAGSSVPATAVAVAMVEDIPNVVTLENGPELMDAIKAETPLRAEWGGVLIDEHGEVLGILDNQMTMPGGTVGLFIPAPLALGVADELASSRRVEPGWMGVKATDAPNGFGAQISGVFSGSPAASAGIQPGDVVTAVDGHKVSDLADLRARLYTTPPGKAVDVTIDRGGTLQAIAVVLAADTGS